MTGHLFDTKAFNQCIDICEEYEIQFMVLNWKVGNDGDSKSSVEIQLMSKQIGSLREAMDKIHEMAEKNGIAIIQHGE